MKITIVADVLGEENNGTTATIKRLIDGLISRGNQIKVVSPYENESSENPKYYSVEKRNFGIFNPYIKKNGVELGKPQREVIRKAIEGSDVVHIELPFKMGKMAVKICRELGVPFTAGFHCQPENFSSHLGLKNSYLFNKLLYSYYKNTFYKNVDYIHCPTEFIANELEKNKYKAKKFAISNGVVSTYKKFESERPKELKDKFLILFIGRMSKEKRHDLLIKAAKLSRHKDALQLVFAGCGPLERKIIKKSKNLKNSPIIGYYPKEKLAEIVNYCDLYVHPSDVEIEAIACIEAISCGLVPVISNSKKSATKYFALDEKGLFEAGDPKSLSEKIDYWIEHPEEKKEYSERYIESSKKYNIENSITEMVKMFELAIKEHKSNK